MDSCDLPDRPGVDAGGLVTAQRQWAASGRGRRLNLETVRTLYRLMSRSVSQSVSWTFKQFSFNNSTLSCMW